jgi:hypothetical protein
LDVGTVESPYLQLHETGPNSDIQPYATLSHCWGQLEIKKLTKENIKDILKGICLSELPKTFQDAVLVTRRLGARFLWIDFLCIIQDSTEDWATESSSMRLIYRIYLVNIVTTTAADGSIGCFFDRDPIFASPCRLRVEKTTVHDFVPSVWQDWVIYAPLNKRAWVVQE